jgi:hypothetical protein
MHVVDLLRLAMTGLLLWLLRPHLALIWRFLQPARVKHRIAPVDGDAAGFWPETMKQLGFVHLGHREERIVGLERRGYQVYYHEDGVFADLPQAAFESSSRKPPVGLYLTTVLPGALFLMTKRVGSDTTRGLYVSQKASGSVAEMLRAHRATMLRLGLGQQVEAPGTLARRAEIFTQWHREHARAELRNFAVLSIVLSLIVGGFLVRMWTI